MLGKAKLHDIYYWMELTRILEERLVALYRTGKVAGGVYTSRGQEATSIGTAYALDREDWLAPMIRNPGSLLVRGFRPEDALAQHLTGVTGPTGARDCRLHMGSQA